MATKKSAGAVARAPSISARMKAEEARYQAQDDLRTMQRAADVQSDPARLKAAQAEAQNQINALKKVGGKK